MKYKLVIEESVLDDIENAAYWYETRQDNLGEKFLLDWESTIDYLISNPSIYQIRKFPFRLCNFQKFPYIILFEIKNDMVIVYSVTHGNRHPDVKYKKKKN